MYTKGIRGAITAEENTIEAIGAATIELLKEIVKQNNIEVNQISHVLFTMTKDLDAVFPAKFARKGLGWKDVPMMCYNELDVQDALKQCIRVLIVINCSENFIPEFVYLKGAKDLRK